MEENVSSIIPDGVELWVHSQNTGGEIKGFPGEIARLFL